jgi:Fe-S-cluster containining protein
MTKDHFETGRALLANPILPLARLIQLLYLTGPFAKVLEIIEELPEPLDAGDITYPRPRALLRPYLPLLGEMERLKASHPPCSYIIHDEEGKLLDTFTSTELWISQQLAVRELEEINSHLCRPCGCTLCCRGPETGMAHKFFEIPLLNDELALFALPRTDSEESRRQTAFSEETLNENGRPFYEQGAALYHWQNGWSMILPQGKTCPQLESSTGHCLIYPQRPEVCRRPQIFAYFLERWPEGDSGTGEDRLPAFISRRKLLAVWDCPYVRELKEEIARYAELSGLEPVFRMNKC